MKYNPCDGPDGTNVSIANSDDTGGDAFALVSTNGETCAYETTGTIFGTSSIRMATATAANPVQVGFTDTAATSARARWYENFTTLPTALQQHGVNFRGASGATTVARTEFQTTGKFRIVMGGTTGADSASALTTGVDYEFEAVISGANGSSGTMTVNCYLRSDGSLFTSATVSGATTAVTIDTGRFGKFNGSGNFDSLWDGLAFETGSAVEIGPYLQSKSANDLLSFLEGTPNVTLQRTDDFVLTAEVAALSGINVSASDTFTLNEDVAETEDATTGGDTFALTEGVTSLARASDRTDAVTFGDDVTRSVPTGAQGVSWGGGFSTDYVVVVDADASDLIVGDPVMLYLASGVLKEGTLFRITSITPPFAGFRNVFITPNAAVLPAAGDVLKVVTPVGATVTVAAATTDAFTLTDTSTLARASDRTDTFTLSEASHVTASAVVVGAAEADDGLPVGRKKTRAVAPFGATETDAARPVARLKSRTVGVATETDVATAVGRLRRRAVGQTTETDAAVAVPSIRPGVVSRATETDVAQPIAARRHSYVLGVATETDAAQHLRVGLPVAVLRVSEADEALHLTARKVKATSPAAETDVVPTALVARRGYVVGVAVEPDAAVPVGRLKVRSTAVAADVETATVLGRRGSRDLGAATEVDVVPTAFTRVKARVATTAVEDDAATAVGPVHSIVIGVSETLDFCSSLPFGHVKYKALPVADEVDVALPIPFGVPGLPAAFRIDAHGREGLTETEGEEPGHLIEEDE